MSSTTVGSAPTPGVTPSFFSSLLANAEAAGEALLGEAEQLAKDLFTKVVIPAAAQEAEVIASAVAAAPTNTGRITQLIAQGQTNVIQAAEAGGIAITAADGVLALGNALAALTPIPATTAAGAATTGS